MRWLTALAALAVAAPVVAVTTPAAAASPAVLPVTVTNNTGRGDAVFLYVIGTMNGRWGYVNSSGAFNPWPAGGNPPVPAPDVSMAGPGNGGTTTIRIPKGLSGRVYMALGDKIKFFITPDGFVQPAPWAPGDPNFNTLFDTSEFTFNDAGLWLNSSQVDFFGIPHAVTVTNGAGQTKRTGDVVNDGRNKIINAIKAQPGWQDSVITRADGTVLRVLAPGKATDAGKFPANYLDAYINSAWNAYTSRTLTVVPRQNEPNRKFFGRTVGNTMRFTDSTGAEVATVDKPSTANVWGCDGVFNAPNVAPFIQSEVRRTICTALVRGTLGTSTVEPVYDANAFYKNSAPNHYSRIIHANMADGKAYGFAYDDVGGFESLVHDGDPQQAGIIMSPFGAGGNPPTPPPATGNRILSNWNNKCVDVSNANFSDGVPLQVWTCNNTAAQAWTFTGNTISTQNNKCMDVAWGSRDNGAVVQIATCSGNAAQQFVLNPAGDLVNPQAGKCVDIAAWNPDDGARLHLWDCVGGQNQKWRRG
ncbi:beta-1,3-glucanase family protein [Actinoplanes sp. DH11]|uniref:beta-1,3-glucanase family protein n=1 Tax=Actinoplanes sp. DH11 TaxID=2857011 RepID=UPI001E3D3F98|nr:beta-1,3-glucanase family protein [Actinoplanes sp. DH11]